MPGNSEHTQLGLLARLSRRGVFRVGASYAVIAWLLLQIGDVVLDPFDFGDSVMRVLLIVVSLNTSLKKGATKRRNAGCANR